MFECDCCGKVFHLAPHIGVDKLFCSKTCLNLEAGIVPEYTEKQRKAINKKLDKNNLLPRTERVHHNIVFTPPLSREDADMNHIMFDRINRTDKVKNRISKDKVRGR
jgi:hypothetical protein